jgi:hypothetical protein
VRATNATLYPAASKARAAAAPMPLDAPVISAVLIRARFHLRTALSLRQARLDEIEGVALENSRVSKGISQAWVMGVLEPFLLLLFIAMIGALLGLL